MASDSKLVYSTDSKLNERCPKCRELKAQCRCEAPAPVSKFTAILRLEKSGRGGKTVTVIDGLPKVNVFLKELTRKLKNRCGSGGTHRLDGKEGIIEIQGDKRELIRALLSEEKIRTKG